MSLTYEEWIKIYTAKDGSCDKDCIINSAYDLMQRQQLEIDMLIRKKEVLRDEIAEQQAEIERLKEIEYMYNDLCR